MVTKCPRGIRKFSWYTNHDACYVFFYGGTFVLVCARVHESLSPQCRGTPRVKPSGKSRLFSSRGAKSFLWPAFLSGKKPNLPIFRPKISGFCGSQQPLRAFPLEEPSAMFPHPVARIDKEKGPWYNVHDPVRVALVSCFQAYARAFLMPR